MTVGYMKDVATVGSMTYMKILLRWRGSIWKSIINELMVWMTIYFIISLIYRVFLFGTEYGVMFEDTVAAIAEYLNIYGQIINFVSAFYMSYISSRWWWLFMEIPWPDTLYMLISALMKSNGTMKARQKERQIRLAIGRYWNLAFVLLLRDICASTKRRFPTLDHLNPYLATNEEISLLRQADDLMNDQQCPQTCLYGLPLDWIQQLIKQAGDDKNFLKAHMTALHEEVVRLRSKMYNLLAQDFICVIPISFTQVAIAAPVVYFTMCLVGKQYLIFDKEGKQSADYVVPFYTIYEFVIYIGWVKAAMAMLNPFGNDDDDFEVDYLIERNNLFSKVILDDLYEVAPTPKHFEFMELPQNLEDRNKRKDQPLIGSTMAKREYI